MLVKRVSLVWPILGVVLFLPFVESIHGEEKAEPARWEYKSVRIENDVTR